MYSDFMLRDQFEDDVVEDLEDLEGRYLITSVLEYQRQLSEGRVPIERKELVKVDVEKRPRPWRESK